MTPPALLPDGFGTRVGSPFFYQKSTVASLRSPREHFCGTNNHSDPLQAHVVTSLGLAFATLQIPPFLATGGLFVGLLPAPCPPQNAALTRRFSKKFTPRPPPQKKCFDENVWVGAKIRSWCFPRYCLPSHHICKTSLAKTTLLISPHLTPDGFGTPCGAPFSTGNLL